ncbi:hypothetical protein Tco_0375085 [Tanacetum coccineum]
MPTSLSRTVTVPTSRRNFQSDERPQNSSKFVKSLTCGASTLWARSRLHEGKRYSRSSRGLLSKWVEAKASPPMMPRIMEVLTVSPPLITNKTCGACAKYQIVGLKSILEGP